MKPLYTVFFGSVFTLAVAPAPYSGVVTGLAFVFMLVVMLAPRWFAKQIVDAVPVDPLAQSRDFVGRLIEAFAAAPGSEKDAAIEAVMRAEPNGLALFNQWMHSGNTLRQAWRARGHTDFPDNGTFGLPVTETDMLSTFFTVATVKRWYMDEPAQAPERFQRKTR